MASSRFPGKPLEKILGISMIQHIYSRVQMCRNVSSIVIATCDKEIINASKKFGAQAVLTSKKHKRSVDRVAEAVKEIELNYPYKIDRICFDKLRSYAIATMQ